MRDRFEREDAEHAPPVFRGSSFMDNEIGIATGYRTKADEVRAKAAKIKDTSLRETLLRIALDYERMAKAAGMPRGWSGTMSTEVETALRYRNYAGELRLIAGDRSTTENRRTLLRVAADYDHLAASLEATSQSKENAGLPP